MKTEKTAVIFARVSSVSDRQNVDRQTADLKKYAEVNKIEVVKVFEEKISGASKERPVLMECLEFCKENKVDFLLISELSRLSRKNIFEISKIINELIDNQINLYSQKEQFTLLDNDGKISVCTPIMLAVLSTCAELERENIKFRLNSGRENYIAKGGRLGRNVGSTKSKETKKDEYKQVISLLKKGTSIRNTATIAKVSVSTVQRIKKEFEL